VGLFRGLMMSLDAGPRLPKADSRVFVFHYLKLWLGRALDASICIPFGPISAAYVVEAYLVLRRIQPPLPSTCLMRAATIFRLFLVPGNPAKRSGFSPNVRGRSVTRVSGLFRMVLWLAPGFAARPNPFMLSPRVCLSWRPASLLMFGPFKCINAVFLGAVAHPCLLLEWCGLETGGNPEVAPLKPFLGAGLEF